ncbi:MAG: 16S rRNA (adenine(1518)-N(6)/adenine(1519)-N(6))-dimethyltransferase RsmA [Minisyncoccota bacterium]
MYHKKSLGQNFLTSQSAVSKIVDTADPSGDDIILEIGPGKGVLTEKLLFFAGKVVAVEKDDNLFEFLKEKFKKEIEANKLDLIHGDILDFDPSVFSFYKDLNYKLVANIPYNITGAILKKFLSAEIQPELMVLMLQKEVAERIVARDKKESILSLSVKIYGEPKYIQTVKAGSFSPAPKVDSAILLIENISKEFFNKFSEERFFEILRAGFKSKRKKLSSNLVGVVSKEKVLETFEKLKLDPNLRAEDLDISGWRKLVESLEN